MGKDIIQATFQFERSSYFEWAVIARWLLQGSWCILIKAHLSLNVVWSHGHSTVTTYLLLSRQLC